LNSTEIPPIPQNVALTGLLDQPTLCGVAIADLGDLPAQGERSGQWAHICFWSAAKITIFAHH
jgi:hypothetical protein